MKLKNFIAIGLVAAPVAPVAVIAVIAGLLPLQLEALAAPALNGAGA